MIKKTILLMLIFCSAIASSAIVSVGFSPTPQGSPGIIYSDSVVFTIITSSPMVCKYSMDQSTAFELMNNGNFELNLETVHKKSLTQLSSGAHKYYVKCRDINDLTNESTEIIQDVEFKTIRPISAQITLEEPVLKAGKHEITVQTIRASSTPSLKYSYDGITYSPIMLYGSGNLWKGFLVISSSIGEEVGSFKFEARDLEGRSGTGIVGNNIFSVDTKSPPIITSLEASGEYGQIKLEWFLDEEEEIEEINIYKSETPNVDLSDHYKTLEGEKTEYTDNQAKEGKTYYYRISSVDAAGNEAGLSKEVYATGLLSKITTSTGLSPQLIGSVDAVLSEIGFVENEIKNSDITILELTEAEKEYAKILKITENLASAKSELNILKRNVESYKEADTTKDILDSKLSSSRIKIETIKKKIPETITTIDSNEISAGITEEAVRKIILEYSPELSPSMIDKTTKKSIEAMEENNFKIRSKINVIETIYLDGKKETQSVLEHFLDSQLEKTEGTKFILQLPSGSLFLESLSIKSLNYVQEQEGLVSFEADAKKITYTIDQKIDTAILKEISVSLIEIQSQTIPLTGYFLSSVPTEGSKIAAILILITSGLMGYLLFIKQQKRKGVSLKFLGKAKKIKSLQKEGKDTEANELYDKLKIEYIALSENQKHEVFKEIKHLTKS